VAHVGKPRTFRCGRPAPPGHRCTRVALYGVGGGFYVWKLGHRAEYERYKIKDLDRVQMSSVNALFQFYEQCPVAAANYNSVFERKRRKTKVV